MKYTFCLFFCLSLIACKKTNGQSLSDAPVKTYAYPSLSAPQFFERLANNHAPDFAAKDNEDFEDFCAEFKLSESDSVNKKKFYTLKILHLLFTSENASNGSKGEILNIPYYWHWNNPNPRHNIISLKNNQKLSTIKPPAAFAKYKSYADIDRTPYLFLSELLQPKPLYQSDFGEFSTFGWCSEREMAFVCLMELLQFKAMVITNGNHSWCEVVVPFQKNGAEQLYKFKVDNTFNVFEWQNITPAEVTKWSQQSFAGQGNWYNQKAHSETEKQNLNAFIVSGEAMKNIEEKVVAYLND